MNSFLTCPDCDDSFQLGPIAVDQDCTLYEQKYSQVCGIILQPNSASAPSDWTSAASWATVIDNAATGSSKSKYLVGEGEIEPPDGDLTEYPKRKQRVTSRLYTVDLTVKNLSDQQYAFLKQLQCGWIDFRFWVETVGERLFGGATGIEPFAVDVAFLYSGGRNDKEEAVLTITYESDGDPPRGDVPGISEAVAGVSTMYTAYGPTTGGDEAYGPTSGGDTVYGFSS